jgi:hypothetical protein
LEERVQGSKETERCSKEESIRCKVPRIPVPSVAEAVEAFEVKAPGGQGLLL